MSLIYCWRQALTQLQKQSTSVQDKCTKSHLNWSLLLSIAKSHNLHSISNQDIKIALMCAENFLQTTMYNSSYMPTTLEPRGTSNQAKTKFTSVPRAQNSLGNKRRERAGNSFWNLCPAHPLNYFFTYKTCIIAIKKSWSGWQLFPKHGIKRG